ncbi:MAG: DMT family transporter [Rhodobacterales bacterium]|nr:DMT family transporter [Rhodobacterales bacterium]
MTAAPVPSAAPYRPLAAALWMTGSVASFTAMAVAGRSVAAELDTFELMLWRSLIGLGLILALGCAAGRLGRIRANRLRTHLVRNVFHFGGQNLWFWSLTAIPLAQVFALEFTSPLWVILLGPWLLAEPITRARALAAALGFLGILIVARPDFGALNPGVLAAAASAIGFAGSTIFTKRLTRHEAAISILFWLTVMQAGFGLATAGWDGDIAWPSAAAWPWVALIGVAGLVAHACLTTALTLAPAAVVVPVDFARLPLIAVVGMLVYAEPIKTAVALGGALILLGNWLNLRAGAPRPAVTKP